MKNQKSKQSNIPVNNKRYILKGYSEKGLNNIIQWEISVEWKNDKWYHFNTDTPIDNHIIIQSISEFKSK